jgi:hypothetical protein
LPAHRKWEHGKGLSQDYPGTVVKCIDGRFSAKVAKDARGSQKRIGAPKARQNLHRVLGATFAPFALKILR